MMRSVLALIVVALCAFRPASAQTATPDHCRPSPLPGRLTEWLGDSLYADARQEQPGLRGVIILAAETLAVATNQGCLTFVAANDGGPHFGVLALFDSTGSLRGWWPFYKEIAHLRPAGRNRVMFEYSTAHGSGIHETQLEVLCTLQTRQWVPCLQMPLEQRYDWRAPWARAMETGVRWTYASRYQLEGDILVFQTSGEWEDYDYTTNPPRQRRGRIPANTVRLRLP